MPGRPFFASLNWICLYDRTETDLVKDDQRKLLPILLFGEADCIKRMERQSEKINQELQNFKQMLKERLEAEQPEYEAAAKSSYLKQDGAEL